jgi:hypothetical protein
VGVFFINALSNNRIIGLKNCALYFGLYKLLQVLTAAILLA